MKQIQRVKKLLPVTVLLLAACSAKVNTGGYVSEKPIKDQVVIGQTSKDDVKNMLGSPSSQSSFGDETWYYITNRQESVAFFKPETTEQDVTQIQFDKNGMAASVKTYNKNDSQEVAMDKNVTPTEGHTLGFVEQLLGNIGRFNHPTDDTMAPGRKTSGGGGF